MISCKDSIDPVNLRILPASSLKPYIDTINSDERFGAIGILYLHNR